MPREDHDLELGQDFDSDKWIAVCSCGRWERECPTQAEAVDAWTDHCDQVFMEATGG